MFPIAHWRAYEHSKEGYYLALRQTQETIRTDTPNWQPWVLFFLRAPTADEAAGQESRKREDRSICHTRIVREKLEYAREHGRVTIGDIVALTGTSRNTLKQHFRQLLEKGHWSGRGRGAEGWHCPALRSERGRNPPRTLLHRTTYGQSVWLTPGTRPCLSFWGFGGPGRDRTDDLFHAMEARSQLRHRPT